ncbi:MAG: four helix bundle protein [Cytophagia bacterium]|nr:four helix bundle protein [Cytophagia bacterium]
MKLEELRVYNRADELSDAVWDLVADMNYFEKDTLGKQLVRSADSISANIAEGFGRYFYKENRQFCFYSRGSLLETKNWLSKCHRRNIISSEKLEHLMSELEEVHISLNAYIKTIGKSPNHS